MKVYRNIFVVGKLQKFRGSEPSYLAYNGEVYEECDEAMLIEKGYTSGVDYVITCECDYGSYKGLIKTDFK